MLPFISLAPVGVRTQVCGNFCRVRNAINALELVVWNAFGCCM